jgi:hypothetical protein
MDSLVRGRQKLEFSNDRQMLGWHIKGAAVQGLPMFGEVDTIEPQPGLKETQGVVGVAWKSKPEARTGSNM